MDIIRISLLGICGVVLGFFLKGTRTEYVSFITMGIGIIILGLAVDKLDYLFRMIGKIQQSLSAVSYTHLVTRMHRLQRQGMQQHSFRKVLLRLKVVWLL